MKNAELTQDSGHKSKCASCGSFDSTIVGGPCEILQVFTSVFAPICLNDRILKFPVRGTKISTSFSLRYLLWFHVEFSAALKLLPSLIAHPAESWKRYLILEGIIFADLPGGFSLSLALVCPATLDIRLPLTRISFGRHGSSSFCPAVVARVSLV